MLLARILSTRDLLPGSIGLMGIVFSRLVSIGDANSNPNPIFSFKQFPPR